jgi:O-antigen ligase
VTIKSFQRIAVRLEPWVIVLLLLGLLGVRAHPILDKPMIALSYGILPILIIGRWKQWMYVATLDIPLLLLSVMPAVSVIWSTSADHSLTYFKGVVRATLFGIYLATHYSLKAQMRLFTWVFGIGTVLSLVLCLALPSYAIDQGFGQGGIEAGVWQGIYKYKNHASFMMALAAILFLLTALTNRRQRWIPWTVFIMAVAILFLTKGKTCYAIFAISLCILPLHNAVKQKPYKLRVFLILMIILLFGSTAVLLISNLEFIVVDTLGKSTELSGRMPIWTLMFDKIYERPWLGYGASGFWTSEYALYVIKNSWAAGVGAGISPGETLFNAHSGYIDLLLQYGFLGTSLVIFHIITFLIRLVFLLTATASIESFWMLQTLLAMVFVNFTERFGFLDYGTLWTIYVSMALSAALELKRMSKKRELSTGP